MKLKSGFRRLLEHHPARKRSLSIIQLLDLHGTYVKRLVDDALVTAGGHEDEQLRKRD